MRGLRRVLWVHGLSEKELVIESIEGLIYNILKQLQAEAQINDMGELSGHSFRVGGAVDMLSKGIPLERIMLRGGWKSEISAMRYLRSWQEEYWSQD